jgi:hypothetical protein
MVRAVDNEDDEVEAATRALQQLAAEDLTAN